MVLQATHAEEAYGPRLQFLSRVVGCSADVRLRAKERPRCAGSLSLRSLDVERHRGSPRRLSTEVFTAPPHNLNRRPQCHHVVSFSAFRHSAVMANGRQFVLFQRIATGSPALTRHASASCRTRPILNRALQPLGQQSSSLRRPLTKSARGVCPNRLDVAQPISPTGAEQ